VLVVVEESNRNVVAVVKENDRNVVATFYLFLSLHSAPEELP